MKTFRITLTETFCTDFEIEARTLDEALDAAELMYDADEIWTDTNCDYPCNYSITPADFQEGFE